MTKLKLPKNVTAVPLRCAECGKHKPLYLLLVKYKTDIASEDYNMGLTEIEVAYDEAHYCKQCIRKLFDGE